MQINLARLPDDVALLQQLVRDLTATVEGQEATLKASRLEIARLKLHSRGCGASSSASRRSG